jgi:hypothetical protein
MGSRAAVRSERPANPIQKSCLCLSFFRAPETTRTYPWTSPTPLRASRHTLNETDFFLKRPIAHNQSKPPSRPPASIHPVPGAAFDKQYDLPTSICISFLYIYIFTFDYILFCHFSPRREIIILLSLAFLRYDLVLLCPPSFYGSPLFTSPPV